MKDNLNVEVEVKESNLPQLDERLMSLKQKLSDRSDVILGVINSIDNDPDFLTIRFDDIEFNLFDEESKPSINQVLRWNTIRNKVDDMDLDKDDILNERWVKGEWSDYVQDNCGNYDGETFDFMKDDWKYELSEGEERGLMSDYLNL